MKRIAIFGGTFNPIHWGHLLVAEAALKQAALDQVIWVPTANPPHKNAALPAFNHRLEMVRRAIADYPAFTVSEEDAQRTGRSYAIATLQDLQALHPQADWYWVMGIDAFQTLPGWRESRTLAAQCTWLIAPRWEEVGKKEKAAKKDGDRAGEANRQKKIQSDVVSRMDVFFRWELLQMPAIEISSSMIRQLLRERRSIHFLVPESVRIYIEMQKLYTR